MIDVLTVAKYVINSSLRQGKPVTNLKLQSILYYIQGECLAELSLPAFEDEIYTWKCGVNVPKVYFEFTSYASEPILRSYNVEIKHYRIRCVIDRVIRNTIGRKTWELAQEIIHEHLIYHKYYEKDYNKDMVFIPKDEIEEYFRYWSGR